ncbi:MAG: hypothetical protein KAW12_18475 [Candidatus Aminicenantes bacterium]|nr:hypothetical protein [Candidatus Aminicenantes bacterium]
MRNRKNRIAGKNKRKLCRTAGLLLCCTCLLLLQAACGGVKYRREATGDFYYSLKIKVNLKVLDSGRKQGMKILLKFSGSKARMLFLGPPLNKIYAKLIVDGEAALLINHRKKKYWRGNFKTLLQEMWDIDFAYREFKKLLLEGIFPVEKVKKNGLEISVEKNKKSGKPGKIRIKGKQIQVSLSISNHRVRSGKIVFSVNLGRMEQSGLQGLLRDED